ncbi:MAG: hypothetical protein HUU20_14275 [Pirellulales bacterium]|nr:hypothetical protein [Pirellulales bacterium]
MVAQIHHINDAALILMRHQGTMKQRLAAACDELWAAMENPEEWPTDLMEHASRIVDKILESSAIGNPVKNMDERTARRVAVAITRLAAELRKRGLVPPVPSDK